MPGDRVSQVETRVGVDNSAGCGGQKIKELADIYPEPPV